MIPASIIVASDSAVHDLMSPRPEDFTLELVARALANKCRYSGLTQFYSVAEHCVRASQLCADPLWALFHELDEVFLPEIPTPLKKVLPQWWHDMALRHMQAGAVAFDIPDLVRNGDLPYTVKRVDEVMLATEVRDLGVRWPDDIPPPKGVPLDTHILPWPRRLAETAFIHTYRQLMDDHSRLGGIL